jgi:hypothetical protein
VHGIRWSRGRRERSSVEGRRRGCEFRRRRVSEARNAMPVSDPVMDEVRGGARY